MSNKRRFGLIRLEADSLPIFVGVPLVGTRKSGCKQYVVSGFCAN